MESDQTRWRSRFSFWQTRDSKNHVRSSTALIYHDEMVDHKCLWDPNYPERPERFSRIMDRCREYGLIDRYPALNHSSLSLSTFIELSCTKKALTLKNIPTEMQNKIETTERHLIRILETDVGNYWRHNVIKEMTRWLAWRETNFGIYVHAMHTELNLARHSFFTRCQLLEPREAYDDELLKVTDPSSFMKSVNSKVECNR